MYALHLGSWDKDWEEDLLPQSAVGMFGYNGVWFGSLGKVRLIPHPLL